MKNYKILASLMMMFWIASSISAQNPIIRDQFTADPTARVFNGKVYLYPSHDIPTPPDKGLREDWFCMEDYHVFSSENLIDWTDHGVIVTQTEVPWLTRINYDMWAPDCVERNGKYYFYFPVGGRIGVAIADKPEGPYTVQEKPVEGVRGIDPCVLIDKDGQAYIYTSMGRIMVAKLKENMVEIEGEVQTIANLPTQGLIEGPFTFEKDGKYYLTYPHVENETERLEYAMGDSPMGPFMPVGVIMDESESGCWTNHHSLVKYKGQWYLFYHDQDYSPNFDKNRSAKIDSLFFNEDGTIQKVIPTNRGVGVNEATTEIQIDRYSAISDNGASIDYKDTTNTFDGWKTMFEADGAWIRYNAVNFDKKLKKVQVKAASENGGSIEIRLDKVDGPVVAEVEIPKSSDWKTVDAKVSKIDAGKHDLVVVAKGNNPVEIDWVQFSK
ncbi:MAG: family 43 glycosylhydrolase [Prolixibacteraceae bacterium]|nr:family 43 glycosylhydrolase [Prolixibacteraceae bacterium]